MRLTYRLTLMFLSLTIFVVIGRLATGSFEFAVTQFWFISGALLLVLISLVDQPHFSKDANIFGNGAAAWVSLFAVAQVQRTALWWVFFAWASYLIVSSFTLMALRSRDLFMETRSIQFFSRINRAIGRPEAIFSAFLLWGIFLQFTYPQQILAINSLLMFWAVFIILSIPSIAETIASLSDKEKSFESKHGFIMGIQSPRQAEARLSAKLPEKLIGKKVTLQLDDGTKVAEGVMFADRIVKGLRQGRIALTSFQGKWSEVSIDRIIEIVVSNDEVEGNGPVGVVAAGSSIGSLVFEVDPRMTLHAGQVVKVCAEKGGSFYQIVKAGIEEDRLGDNNAAQSVKVTAGQLGHWKSETATFEPIDWVPPAGELVEISEGVEANGAVPAGRCVVGAVPKSRFPVHVHVADTITHNTALIGVTGSGKSYLAFHLIEAYLDAGIKVLILDLTRQHLQFLSPRSPTKLTGAEKVAEWLNSNSNLAIHQFATAGAGFPKATADFVEQCFDWLSKQVKLSAGTDAPARLCIVLEEAHSLIPEWNQVAQDGDKAQVNRTARIVLQGRKYGLGTLLITQRTANVTKTILNQCNTIFALRSFDQTGLDFLRNYMGDEYSQAISTLPQLTAVLVGKASSSARPIILKVTDFKERWNGHEEDGAPPGDEVAAPAAPASAQLVQNNEENLDVGPAPAQPIV